MLSFDLGVENLGIWCGFIGKYDDTIDAEKMFDIKRPGVVGVELSTLYWNRVKIVDSSKPCGNNKIGEKVESAMTVLPSLLDFLLNSYGPNIVIIESQITNSFFGEGKKTNSVGNITMKVFSHIIQSLLIERTKIPIHFVNGSATIPLCENIGNTSEYLKQWGELEPRGIKRTKYQKKKLAVRACTVFITKDEQLLFEKHKKRDDLADALFQALTYFLRDNKNIENKEIIIKKKENISSTIPTGGISIKKHSKNKSDLILELISIKNETLSVDDIKSFTVVQLKNMIREIKEEKTKIHFF
jgi:hypothetical protein